MNLHDAASFSALVDRQLEGARRGLDALLSLPEDATAEQVAVGAVRHPSKEDFAVADFTEHPAGSQSV